MRLGLGADISVGYRQPLFGGVPLLLDTYTGAAAAYSLRQLRTGVTNVVRVREDSGNTEQDFTAEEITDGTLLAFVGAGNNGYVVTWYDQSGNGNDATQATAANQPKIVDAGVLVEENGKPAIDFDGNKSLTESSVSLTQPFSYFGVRKYNNDGLNREVFVQQNNSDYSKLIDISFINNNANFGSYINGDTETYNQTLRYILANGVSSQIQDNGGTLYTDDGGTNGVNGLRIGYAILTSFFETNVKGQEIIIYNTDQSANRASIQANINDHYSIYP